MVKRSNNPRGRPSLRTPATCQQCGKGFTVRPSEIKKGAKFCSRKCYLASIAAQVARLCPVCGKTFTVPFSNASRYTVCSRACKTVDTAYTNCLRCGTSFRMSKADRKYCSEVCRRPTIKVSCRQCSNEFRVSPSGKDSRKFCSMSCYHRFRGET